jgi:dihydroorotate dehydrogenase (NAD+) catalytic subunit
MTLGFPRCELRGTATESSEWHSPSRGPKARYSAVVDLFDRLRGGGSARRAVPDLSVTFGRLTLPNPIMPASGTFGHGTELAAYVRLDELGAVVVKSLSAKPWRGNPPPRLVPLNEPGSMINSVGLPNPGVTAWGSTDLPALLGLNARVVASIWGHTREEFLDAAKLLAELQGPVAWEVNFSCPNLDRSNELFAFNPALLRDLLRDIREIAGEERVLWAKLSPDVPDIVEVAEAAMQGSADAVTLANSVSGMKIDIEKRSPALGNKYGGVSGRVIHPLIVSLVYQVHAALPELPIVAAGGVFRGLDAIEFMMAGASAVQVGTANFADPRATSKVLSQVEAWCRSRGCNVRDIIGTAEALDTVG